MLFVYDEMEKLDVKSESKATSGKSKKGFGFSWSLNREPLILEDSIPLTNKAVNVSGNSLQEIKDNVNDGIVDALDCKFKKSKEKLRLLKGATENQIQINYGEMNFWLNDLMSKRNKLVSENKGQYTEESAKLFVLSEGDIEQIRTQQEKIHKSQVELEIQRRLLEILTTEKKNWVTILDSSFLQSPQIEFLVGGKKYDIFKGDKCDEDWNPIIKETIKNKIEEIKRNANNDENNINYFKNIDDLDDYMKFVLRVCFAPFKINGEYDKETIQYYIYNIIKCIKDTDIIGKLALQYNLFKEETGRLSLLEQDLKCIESAVDDIILECGFQDPEGIVKDKEVDNLESLEQFEWNNVYKLKMGSFIRYLERNKNSLEGPCDKILKIYRERLADHSQEDFDAKIELGGSPIISDSDSAFLKNKTEFLSKSKIILEFLGKSLDDKSKTRLNELFEKMKGGGRKKNVEDLKFEDLGKIFLKMLNFKENGSEWTGKIKGDIITIDKWALKNVFNKSKSELYNQRKEGLYGTIKELEPYLPDVRVYDINSAFNAIFGITVSISNTSNMTDSELLQFMFRGLALDVESQRKKPEREINSMVDKLKKERLKGTQAEECISHELELILNKVVSSHLRDCYEDINQGEFVKNIEELKKTVNELKLGLENCVDSDEFNELENRIKGVGNDVDTMRNEVEIIYARYKMYKKLDEGVYDYNDTTGGLEFNNVKKVACLKELFKCDKLSLDDKFYYCSEILKKSIITAKSPEHHEILKHILVKKTVEESKDNFQHVKLGDLKSILSKFMEDEKVKEIFDKFGEDAPVNKIYLEDKLEEKYSIYKICEVIVLAIFKTKSDLGSDEKYELKRILKVLGVENDKIDEIEKLDRQLPGVLESYIEKSLSNGAFKSEKLSEFVINYKTGKFNFSVMQIGILECAVEMGKVKEVLEYVGFYFNPKLNIPNMGEAVSFKERVKNVISQLYNSKKGCFGGGNENLLNYVNDIRNMKHNKFTIGGGNDEYRLDGVSKNGFFVIINCFKTSTQHDDHTTYVAKKVIKDDINVYEKCTHSSWGPK